jgi:hypothetical protein
LVAEIIERGIMGLMNNGLERTRKEAIMVSFKTLSQYFSGGSEENHKEPQQKYPISGPKFEPWDLPNIYQEV